MRRYLLTKLTLLFVLFALGGAMADEAIAQDRQLVRKFNQLLEEGNRAFNQKSYDQAIDKYAEALVISPKNATAHFWKGMAHFYKGDHGFAARELTWAEEQNFEKPLDIYRVRWRIYYASKDLDQALSDVNSGLEIDPDNTEFLIASGDINFAQQDYDEAYDAYQRVLDRAPNKGEIYLNLAKIEYSRGNSQGQVDAARNAIQNGTTSMVEAYLLLGDGHQKTKNFSEAAKSFQQALNIDPKNYDIYRSVAELYRLLNQFDDAILITRRAIQMYPNDGNLYTDISWYYSLADRHEEAIDASLAGTKLLPNQSLAYTNLCRAYNDVKKPEMAVNACNTALKLNPGDGETHFYLGRAYSMMNRQADADKNYKAAIDGLEKLTQARPDNSDAFYLLGNAYFSEQPSKAISAYERCLEISPRFAKARFNLALLYLHRGNKAKANEQYEAMLEVDAVLAKRLKAEIDK